MDQYPNNEIADEFAALGDPRLVMEEVVRLVGDLRLSAHRLGDAIAGAGFSAREWRGDDARLFLLSDQLPDITVDALITRLAEFSAANGPAWLHGGASDIARFTDEVEILYGVVRPLRTVAHRLRMLPVRRRDTEPLELALGSARVGTPLDLVAGALRDLDTLSPYLVPLADEEWSEPVPAPARSQSDNLDRPISQRGQDSYAASLTDADLRERQSYTRLRDFAPAPSSAVTTETRSPNLSGHLIMWLKENTGHLPLRKWVVMAAAVAVLGVGTLLLSIAPGAGSGQHATSSGALRLVVSPATVSLSCRGSGTSLELSLRNTGSTQLNWSVSTPVDLLLSATHGSIAAGRQATLQIRVKDEKAGQGTMEFTYTNGRTKVSYAVRC